ncbi:MAG: hypothetical protein CMH55_10300 [Myxococcales bacterium]|nr:hypothetical protein [Myxococcales bacterium]
MIIRSLNARAIAILYFGVLIACGDPEPDIFHRTADLLGLDLQKPTVWQFSVDDGSEESWTFTPSQVDGSHQILLQRQSTIDGIPLPNPREDLLGIDALGLAWLRHGDCAVVAPPCRELQSAPLLVRLPFPPEMEPETTDVGLLPAATGPGRLRTRGVLNGLSFELVYSWDWDGGGESTWMLESNTGLLEFTDVIAGGSPRHGSRL